MFGAIPKKLVHFTTAAGAKGIAGSGGRVLAGGGVFGRGVYATPGSTNFWVPKASTVAVELTGEGFMRIIPGQVFLKGGSGLTLALPGLVSIAANAGYVAESAVVCGCD